MFHIQRSLWACVSNTNTIESSIFETNEGKSYFPSPLHSNILTLEINACQTGSNSPPSLTSRFDPDFLKGTGLLRLTQVVRCSTVRRSDVKKILARMETQPWPKSARLFWKSMIKQFSIGKFVTNGRRTNDTLSWLSIYFSIYTCTYIFHRGFVMYSVLPALLVRKD